MATNLATALLFGMMSGNDAAQHPSPALSLPSAKHFVPGGKISEFGRALSCFWKAAHKLNPLFFFPLWKETLDKKSLLLPMDPPNISSQKELRRAGVSWGAMVQTPPDPLSP